MRYASFTTILILILLTPTLTKAETLSGKVSILNRNVLDDLFVQSDKPTVKASAAINLSKVGIKNCSFDSYVAIGVGTSVGNEFDAGGFCSFNLNETVKTEVSVSHYFLKGETDMTAVIGTVTAGPVDVSLTKYIVYSGFPDATKMTMGYSISPDDRLSARGFVTYEHGFGVSDAVVGGLETEYEVAERLFLTGAIYVPLHQKQDNGLKTQLLFGLKLTF